MTDRVDPEEKCESTQPPSQCPAIREGCSSDWLKDEGDVVWVQRKYPDSIRWLAIAATIGFGVYCVMAFKWQNLHSVSPCDDCVATQFHSPLLQTQLMELGEALGLLIWWAETRYNKAHSVPAAANPFKSQRNLNWVDFDVTQIDPSKPEGKTWWWWITSSMDFIATILCNYAMILTYASTVQMLRNFMIVVAAVSQLFILQRALKIHEWLGVFIITAALILSAIPSILYPDPNATPGSSAFIGIILAIIGTSLQAVLLLVQEAFFMKARYSPLRAVGWEGVAGIVFTLITWPLFKMIGLEDMEEGWYQIFQSKSLLLISLSYIPAVIIFNAAGLAVTKLAGGLLRGVAFAVRAPIIWVISLAIAWQAYDHWNLASIFVFVIGFCLYTNVTPPPVRKSSWQEWLEKPIHIACTDPALDNLYADPAKCPDPEMPTQT